MTDVDATADVESGAAGDGDPTAATGSGVDQSADAESVVDQSADAENDLEESFDPVGTAVLIGIYMAIVVLMWIFTYFVEFLGRGVTIVG